MSGWVERVGEGRGTSEGGVFLLEEGGEVGGLEPVVGVFAAAGVGLVLAADARVGVGVGVGGGELTWCGGAGIAGIVGGEDGGRGEAAVGHCVQAVEVVVCGRARR